MSIHPIKMAYDAAKPVLLDDDAAEWSDPTPLPSQLPEVPDFSPAMLPADLRPWVEDVADRMQCPIDFVAIPAMVAAGSLIGRRIGIRPEAKTPWTEAGNLWGCIVGTPGVMKSPAVREALAPVRALERKAAIMNQDAQEAFRKAEALHKVQSEAARAQARGHLQKGESAVAESIMAAVDEPQPPIEKRFLTTDATVEKLGLICRDNPMGLLVHRDELLTLFQELDRSEKSVARGFFLSGWGGLDGYTFDRVIRGTVRVPSVNISLIGTTQPNRLADYLRDSLQKHDDGMVQRLQMLTFPDEMPEWRPADRYADAEARRRAFECYEGLAELVPASVGAELDEYDEAEGIPFLRFDDRAVEQFVEWRSYLEERVKSDELPSYLSAHLAKYRGLIPRLALIMHLAGGGRGPVPQSACVDAITWAEYLEAHAERAYAAMAQARAPAAKLILKRVRSGDLPSEFTEREVYRPQWSGLRDKQEISEALQTLAEHDWVRSQVKITGGRPTRAWQVNPAAVADRAVTAASFSPE